MNCPENTLLFDFVDGALPARGFRVIEKHLAVCADCRTAAAALRAEEQLLREALEPPPDTSRMARRVVERLRDGDRPAD